jgi:hypothetical protein
LDADEEAQRREVTGELVIVEQDPAPDLALLLRIACAELAGALGKIVEDHARLRDALAGVLEHGHLSHLAHAVTEFILPRLAVEKIDPHGFPIRFRERQHEGSLVRVARLAHAVKFVFSHRSPWFVRRGSCVVRQHGSLSFKERAGVRMGSANRGASELVDPITPA